MTDTPTGPMAELIERLEKAQEGSRHLDSWIAAHVGIGKWTVAEWAAVVNDPTFGPEPAIPEAPHYTTSLDAALMLVPKGFAVAYFGIWPGEPSSLKVLGTHKAPDGRYWHESMDGVWEAEAATPALAICVGALKAKESTNDR